jgi:Flp pilus assembly protein TadD
MKRLGFLTTALLISACSQAVPQLRTGVPSLNSARAAQDGGAPEIALNICQRIAAGDRRNAEALACEGNALTALKRPDEADAAYTNALVLAPDSQDALLGLGRLRLSTDPKRAEAFFRRVIARAPRNAIALNDLGIALDLQGRHAEAQKNYGAAIAANPDMRAAQVNLALSTALGGHPEAAVDLLTPLATRSDASARERHDLAAALAMAGRPEEAARLLSPDLQGADLDAAIAGYRSLLAR